MKGKIFAAVFALGTLVFMVLVLTLIARMLGWDSL